MSEKNGAVVTCANGRPHPHTAYCDPIHRAETPAEQHCGHCEGLLVWGFNSYVHADPNTECLAFGGRQLQPASDPAATPATGCKECGEIVMHADGCSFDNILRDSLVKDSERAATAEVEGERLPTIDELREANDASEHITAEDLAIRFNTTDEVGGDNPTATTEASGEAPERVTYGMCNRHGFCETSHRCAVYDGEASLEYILRSTHDAEAASLREALRELTNSAIEFDDPRTSYVLMQVDRGALEAARTLLNPTREGEE